MGTEAPYLVTRVGTELSPSCETSFILNQDGKQYMSPVGLQEKTGLIAQK